MKRIELNSSVIKKDKTPSQAKADTYTQVSSADKISSASKIEQTKPKKEKTSLLTKIKNLIKKYNKLPLGKKIIVSVISLLLILVIGESITYMIIIYNKKAGDISFPEKIVASTSKVMAFEQEIKIPFPNPPRDQENPINGELYTVKEMKDMESRYPIAVMIENHIDARPQSGYNSADLVFETLAEGGITRTMAIFWGKDVEEIGPIRSARQYYLEWLMPFDPLYMHIGYASSTDPKVNAGGNIAAYGIKTLDRYGTFWRSTKKYAPHNAYTSTELLYQKAKDYGYTGKPGEIDSWKFKKDEPENERGTGPTTTITFFERLWNGGIYDITWKYDRNRNVYLRFNNNTKYTDDNTQTQVYAKNVIIQRVKMTSTFDAKAHIIITTIGSGDAVILRDGQVTEGTWKKKDLKSRTHYYDKDEKEIVFNRGITWIEAVPIDEGKVKIDK